VLTLTGSHQLVNQTLQRQWGLQQSQIERKLGPGVEGWDENAVLPNEIRQRLGDGSLAPVVVRLRPGDAVICHYLLVHEVSPNYGSEIRMQLYLRVKDKEFDNCQSMVEMWRDYRSLAMSHAPILDEDETNRQTECKHAS
jgi:hypothetical protein